MERDETADRVHTKGGFWLRLTLDVLLAAIILAAFCFCLGFLPQHLLYEELQDTPEVGTVPSVTDEAAESQSAQMAEVSFGSELENSVMTPESVNSDAGYTAEVGVSDAGLRAEDPDSADSDVPPFREKYAEFFSDEIRKGKTSYTSPDISVQVTVTEDAEHGSKPFTVYVADIHVASVQNIQAGFPRYYPRASVDEIAQENKAVLAVNGDYFLNIRRGLLVRNGTLLRDVAGTSDLCVLYSDGTMRTYGPADISPEEIMALDPWQVWGFGPALLEEDGQAKQEFNTSSRIRSKNPRTVIGYYEPGHYCLVVVDGRMMGGSNGANVQELAELMSDLGCRAAYNLDGGDSSVMVFRNHILSKPSGGGRVISDAVMVCELPTAEIIMDRKGS